MTRRELLTTYIINNRAYLEGELYEHQRRLQLREPETGDGLRLELAVERLSTFNALSSAITELMRMSADPEDVRYVAFDCEYLRLKIEQDRERIKNLL